MKNLHNKLIHNKLIITKKISFKVLIFSCFISQFTAIASSARPYENTLLKSNREDSRKIQQINSVMQADWQTVFKDQNKNQNSATVNDSKEVSNLSEQKVKYF